MLTQLVDIGASFEVEFDDGGLLMNFLFVKYPIFVECVIFLFNDQLQISLRNIFIHLQLQHLCYFSQDLMRSRCNDTNMDGMSVLHFS